MLGKTDIACSPTSLPALPLELQVTGATPFLFTARQVS